MKWHVYVVKHCNRVEHKKKLMLQKLRVGSLILFYMALTSTTSTTASWWSSKVTSTLTIDSRFVVGTYYVWSDVCVMLLQNEFWEICNSAFKIAESKQAFGHILLGNTIANLFIGFVFVPGLERLEITTASRILIIASIAGVLACMMATSIVINDTFYKIISNYFWYDITIHIW